MKSSMIWRSTFREIRQSMGRFLAILAIVALGVGFFAGLKVTKNAMLKTTGNYFVETEFYDYRLLSTLGFEEEDVEYLSRVEDVVAVEGTSVYDIICIFGDGTESVARVHGLTDKVNQLKVSSGRLPQKADECVVDANAFDESHAHQRCAHYARNNQITHERPRSSAKRSMLSRAAKWNALPISAVCLPCSRLIT